jgi:hypothetical protein
MKPLRLAATYLAAVEIDLVAENHEREVLGIARAATWGNE